MKINDKMVDPGAEVYYSKEFRDMMESHMAYLRALPSTQADLVQPLDADVWNGDLFGYLTYKKIPMKYQWVIMRVNNFYTPLDFSKTTTQLLIPSFSEVDSLRQSWKATSTGVIDF